MGYFISVSDSVVVFPVFLNVFNFSQCSQYASALVHFLFELLYIRSHVHSWKINCVLALWKSPYPVVC